MANLIPPGACRYARNERVSLVDGRSSRNTFFAAEEWLHDQSQGTGAMHPHRNVYAARRMPVITATAVGVAVAATVVQYTVPSAVPSLQRGPGVLETQVSGGGG
jgi:hypothetical protein